VCAALSSYFIGAPSIERDPSRYLQPSRSPSPGASPGASPAAAAAAADEPSSSSKPARV